MNTDNPLKDYQEQCEYCGNPPGTRCESSPSQCPYKKDSNKDEKPNNNNTI